MVLALMCAMGVSGWGTLLLLCSRGALPVGCLGPSIHLLSVRL